MLNKSSYFSLINAANVSSGLMKQNHVKSQDDLTRFETGLEGLPILIAADPTVFDFDTKNVFKIDNLTVCKSIYRHSDTTYVGFKHAITNNKFLSNFDVKSEYLQLFQNLIDQNKNCLRVVAKLKQGGKRIGAFQTRNIPHFGHEAILSRMLDQCDHLVINPVLGPKKKGDVKLEILDSLFQDLAKRKYESRISFQPIIANMYYAGPWEAVHHTILRQRIGFDLFSVGRDHAGADGMYEPQEATEFISRMADKLDIDVICHSGAIYCEKCNQVLLVNDCDCGKQFTRDISGTEFRKAIFDQRVFPLADRDMQCLIQRQNLEVFEQ